MKLSEHGGNTYSLMFAPISVCVNFEAASMEESKVNLFQAGKLLQCNESRCLLRFIQLYYGAKQHLT